MSGVREWWQRPAMLWLAVLLSIVPLLWPQIPPLTDLPGHIGRYRVMLGTDADVLGQWYRFEWRLVGNLGIDLIVYAIAPVIGLEPAVKLAIVATVALFAGGILWVSHEVHGQVTPFAWFALPLAYAFPLQFGFVNYWLAMALALNAFALWLRLGRQGRIGLRAALFVPIACIVWVAHLMGWAALCLMVFPAEVARQRATGRSWVEAVFRGGMGCLPLGLPLVLLIAWRSDSGSGATGRYFERKPDWLITVLRDRWRSFDIASGVLLIGLIAVGSRDRHVARSWMLTAVAGLFALAYLLLPFVLLNSAYADMRLAPFVLLFALVAMRPGEAMPPRIGATFALLALSFFLARTAGSAVSYWQYDRDWQRQLAALNHMPRGARMVSLVGEPCAMPWSRSRLIHLPAIALARRAAFANDQWRIDGSALLTVTARDVQPFANDPSQMVLPNGCHSIEKRQVDDALAAIPRGAFDYLWLIDPPAHDPSLLAGMRPIWRDGTSVLYRIERGR
ncbi:hypothetical protein [Sphingomonas turrisvirgatae]|uniref:Glycosyltransferase RgtA/B/C/D-like domain-containing protein n=1 Tax=Sphingomonas turrisvirgatae TaxID=1888892 RepID=A0A1E3LWD5_9SPHN|nr:hypothetical protein [Sphingomonas turrisvirgatae]ODP38092.1 hypothetical protein BFL28_15860 [Sphingomonas turrisvirgatae]